MIQAIVLAAGLGTRMGGTKPLAFIDGEPALARVLGAIRAAEIGRPILVLAKLSAEQIAAAVDLAGSAVIVNDQPQAGMGSSLRLGLDAVPRDAAGVLVFHADMPFVHPATIRAVLEAASRGSRIAAPFYRGQRGFPVFFQRSCLPGLRRSLTGDAGGRAYIAAHQAELATVRVDDPGCVHDLDRPDDLIEWKGGRTCATAASPKKPS